MTTETTVQEFLAANVPAQLQDGALINIFDQVKKEVNSEVQDVTTVEGRRAIRDNAQKVTATRKAIDDQLRSYLRELKALPRLVEKSARDSIDRFDGLKYELLAGMQAAYIPQQVVFDSLEQIEKSCNGFTIPAHELQKTLLEVEAIDLAVFWPEHKAKARKKIKEVIELLTVKYEAAAQAEAHQAELEKVRAEKEAAEREALKAQIAADEKIRAQLAIERAKTEAEEAKQLAAMQHAQELQKAQQAAEMAAQIEREKVAAQQAAEKEAEEKRAADQENRIAKNREALADFMAQGLSEEDAKKVITMIFKKQIRNISINY